MCIDEGREREETETIDYRMWFVIPEELREV